VRYIRKLFRDPINPNGQWGLLYLMPGGQAIYDPVAAQRAQEKAASADADGSSGDGTSGGGMTGGGMPGTGMPGMPGMGLPGMGMSRAGVTPISSFSAVATGGMAPGAAVPPALMGQGGMAGMPGMQPGGGMPMTATGVPGMGGTQPFSGVLPPPKPANGTFDADSPSEPPIGWQIVGVISRVEGKRNDLTFKTFKGKEKVNEWMFHIFDRGVPAAQAPGLPVAGGSKPPFMGPGFGGQGPIGGIGPGPFGNNGPNGGGPGGGRRGMGNVPGGGNADPNRNNATGN
jgi:hypothetical protein